MRQKYKQRLSPERVDPLAAAMKPSRDDHYSSNQPH
jgi:hypothetical protein